MIGFKRPIHEQYSSKFIYDTEHKKAAGRLMHDMLDRLEYKEQAE